MDNVERAKIIDQLRRNPKTRREIFLHLSLRLQEDIFFALPNMIRRDIMRRMSNDEAAAFLSRLDADDITDALQLLSSQHYTYVLKLLPPEKHDAVKTLLSFDPQTAGGVMSVDYVTVADSEEMSIAMKKLQLHEKRTGRLPTVVVRKTDGTWGRLVTRSLLFGHRRDLIKKYTKRIPTIPVTLPISEVIDTFEQEPIDKVGVIALDGKLLGIIYSEDIVLKAHEQETQALYEFAGVSKQETVFDSAAQKVTFRYQWLVINLGTAFLASFVVGLFENTISKHVLLAVYMPIVAGMGGNAGTQTLAVMVRGISHEQIRLRYAWQTLKNEAIAGLINGLINGLIVAIVVMVLDHDALVAITLGTAMVTNLVVASTFGTIIPLIMQKLGKDPASSATIFITTATDVLGFLAFLGLATVLLN